MRLDREAISLARHAEDLIKGIVNIHILRTLIFMTMNNTNKNSHLNLLKLKFLLITIT